MDMLNMILALKKNPAQLIQNRLGVTLPPNLNRPEDIIQYLLNNGKVSQQQVNQAMRELSRLRR